MRKMSLEVFEIGFGYAWRLTFNSRHNFASFVRFRVRPYHQLMLLSLGKVLGTLGKILGTFIIIKKILRKMFI